MIKKLRPPQRLVFAFGALIILGSLILMLPGFTVSGDISYTDALFTATSSVCVTGLVVQDTGTYFTGLGQVVIMLMIQLGGLGVMTFSTIFFYLLGRQPALKDQAVLQDTFSPAPVRNLSRLLVSVVLFAMVVEGVGTVVYFIRWIRDFPPGKAFFMALFHSVSAFCNAGFCLLPDSLSRYRADCIINLNTIFLIITGGIGFLVLLEFYDRCRGGIKHRRKPPLSLHTRLTLNTTVLLIVLGSLYFFVVEYNNDMLRGFSFFDKVLISLFQSVTARTAGFNTVDFYLLSNATLFFFAILMFIGASPGSCGGGVKTTTIAVFFAIVRSKLKGEEHVHIMDRTISSQSVARTISVIISSILIIIIVTTVLLLTQLGSMSHVESRGMFLEYLFEAVSAFGTVGLSMGATTHLNCLGKLMIIILMFAGRLGPLTLALSIRTRDSVAPRIQYTQENVMIG